MDEQLNLSEQNIEIQLPSETAEASEFEQSLISDNISKAISGNEITNVMMKETEEIISPSYMIDFSACEKVLVTTLDTIAALVIDESKLEEINELRTSRGDLPLNADTALYIKNYEGVIFAGMCDGHVLYRQLESFITGAFDGRVKLYKNNGSGFTEAKKNDVSSVKLKL